MAVRKSTKEAVEPAIDETQTPETLPESLTETPETLPETLPETPEVLPENVQPSRIVVQWRDTWSLLGEKYNVDPLALAEFNKMTIHSMLFAGSPLNVP
jgi:hypothetical protein